MKRVKHQSEGTNWANKSHAADVARSLNVKIVDNAGKFYSTKAISLNDSNTGVYPTKKKLNVEIK